MLQEAMLGEEYQLICGSSVSLAAPGTPTMTARTAGSNETTVGANGTFDVKVTATNWFGETAASTAATGSTSAGQVVDVTIPAVTGAMNYNIYVSTNGTNYYLMAQGVGGIRFTLQGTPPSAGTSPPAADTGTGKSTRIEGVIPTLTGLSADGGIYPTSPVMWQAGYVNQSVGTHLSYNAIYTALENLWQQTGNSPGAFKADPAELISSGIDIANLSTDVISQGAATNYQLFIQQNQVGDVTVGAAVSQFQNPLTRSILKLVVHPWYTQGNAELLSYQLPQTWTNVANAWEMTMVQDMVSINARFSLNRARWRGRVTCRGKRHCSGNPAGLRGILSCGDARRSAETVCAGSVLGTDARGIARGRPQIMRQYRPHAMGKRERRAEMTRPVTLSCWVMSNNVRMACHRCHLPLFSVRIWGSREPRAFLLGAPRRNSAE